MIAILGVGNPHRRDDGLGREVVARVAARLGDRRPDVQCAPHSGEISTLMACFEGVDEVVIIDAMRSAEAPGSIARWDVTHVPLEARLGSASTHALGVVEAVELARALGSLPDRVVIYGVEVENVSSGRGFSAPVEAVLDACVARVLADVGE